MDGKTGWKKSTENREINIKMTIHVDEHTIIDIGFFHRFKRKMKRVSCGISFNALPMLCGYVCR